jgi:hypothetical protein
MQPVSRGVGRFMSEPLDQQNSQHVKRYFVIILLVPIALLAGWVVFKIGLEHRFAGYENAGYPGYVAGPPPEVLFIGSSHTRQSYDISAIESVTKRTAYALAYGSLDPNLMNLLLEEMLPNPAHRPKAIVLEAYSAKLARKPELDDPRLFFDLPPNLKFKFLDNYFRIHPDLSARLDMFDLVVNRGTDQLLTYPLNRKVLSGLSYKGAYQGKVVPGVSEGEFRTFQADIASSDPDPIQFAAFQNIIRLCKRYGVQLLVAESPMPEPITSKPEIQSLKKAFRAVCAENDLPYLDGDLGFPIDDPAFFADASHLSSKGRSLYTSNLLDRFGPLLSKDEQIANTQSPAGMAQAYSIARGQVESANLRQQ